MIEQTDERTIAGYNGSYAIKGNLGGIPMKSTIGMGFRADRAAVQLWHSPDRERLNNIANSIVFERSMNGWISEEFRFSSKWKAELGLRIDYFTFDVEDLLPADSNHIDLSGLNYQSLAQPKFNLIYSPVDNVHFFLNSGIGFHSNDARSVVLDKANHRLPLAAGGEVGTQIRYGSLLFSVAVWMLELENELVYVGDEGTTEDNGPSRRRGIDFSGRYQILNWLYADVDVNYSKGILLKEFFGEKLNSENLIPLAPRLTSTGGLNVIRPRGWEGALRYRLMADRPANELNTVTAEGYLVLDAAIGYRWEHWRLGLNVENMTNTEWNEAQFDTESKLFNEPEPLSELHFTPGTPLAFKGSFTYFF
ncbi:MAG: TonB-dependent receptor [Chitinophagales bacterium]|nr:TonB-dependent receptor [Chitinophagales bacterium]